MKSRQSVQTTDYEGRLVLKCAILWLVVSCQPERRCPETPQPTEGTAAVAPTAHPKSIEVCGVAMSRPDNTTVGEKTPGRGEHPDLAICLGHFMNRAFHAVTRFDERTTIKHEVERWFCEEATAEQSFKFWTALETFVPATPPIFGKEELSADWEKRNRASACEQLHSVDFEKHLVSLFRDVTDNRDAHTKFNECVRDVLLASKGELLQFETLEPPEGVEELFTLAATWHPPKGTTYAPVISSLEVVGEVDCCPLSLHPGQQLTAYARQVQTCRRTGEGGGTVTLTTHTGGSEVVRIPERQPPPPEPECKCSGNVCKGSCNRCAFVASSEVLPHGRQGWEVTCEVPKGSRVRVTASGRFTPSPPAVPIDRHPSCAGGWYQPVLRAWASSDKDAVSDLDNVNAGGCSFAFGFTTLRVTAPDGVVRASLGTANSQNWPATPASLVLQAATLTLEVD